MIPQFVYSVRSASSIMNFIFVVAFEVWITRIINTYYLNFVFFVYSCMAEEPPRGSYAIKYVIYLFIYLIIKRDPKKDFKVTESTKVCSEHFTPVDFISSSSQKRKLKNVACPSVFSWTSQAQERSLPSKRSKLQEEQEILEAEITATASEGEGKFDETDRENVFSRATQVDIEVACTHRFSINILRSLCDSPEREVKYFSHFTGFK